MDAKDQILQIQAENGLGDDTLIGLLLDYISENGNLGHAVLCIRERAEFGKEDPEPLEPEEGDWVTHDYVNFRQHQPCDKECVRVPDGQDWIRVIKDRMDADQFWPNVWWCSDRGNYHIIRVRGG